MKIELNTLIDKMKEVQTKNRFRHTMRVADTAACLAMRYEASVESAYLAGLLHDAAKCLSDAEILEECKKYNLPVKEVEEKNAYLLHAKLGAYYAKEDFGIEDPEILSAISYHTTGKPDMSLLEKIIFTADYIEPGRKPLPNLEHIRHTAFINLDEAVFLILDSTIRYLESISSVNNIDHLTIETYEYYKQKRIELDKGVRDE